MDAKTLVQTGADTWNSRDQEGFFATYADDCEITAPGFTGKGRQGLTDFWNAWHTGFSDNQSPCDWSSPRATTWSRSPCSAARTTAR
jgi:hypothetical protein